MSPLILGQSSGYVEFLFVNYVLYILYVSKIYNKLMYIDTWKHFFGELGVKHHCEPPVSLV